MITDPWIQEEVEKSGRQEITSSMIERAKRRKALYYVPFDWQKIQEEAFRAQQSYYENIYKAQYGGYCLRKCPVCGR